MVDENTPLILDLRRTRIRTIIWATGFRPDWSWLKVHPSSTARVRLSTTAVSPSLGLYVMRLQFLRVVSQR